MNNYASIIMNALTNAVAKKGNIKIVNRIPTNKFDTCVLRDILGNEYILTIHQVQSEIVVKEPLTYKDFENETSRNL